MAVLEFEFKGIDQNFRSSASNVLNDIDKIKKAFGSIGVGIGVDLKTALDGQKVALNDTKIQTQELVKAGKELDNQNKQTRNSIAELTLEQKKLTAEQRSTRANLQDSPYSKLSRELNEMRNEAKNLGAQMILLDSAGMKTSSTYNTLENRFKQVQKETLSLDNSIKKLDSDLGQNNRRVGAYGNALGGLQQKQSGANGVAMEFNRIIQDAPFGMMGIGNNIQQLAANWQTYTEQAKAAAVANGTTVTSMSLVKGAISSILSPANLLTLGIAAVTSGWTFYTMQQQKANKATKEAKESVEDLRKSMDLLSLIQAETSLNASKDITKLNMLSEVYKSNKVSVEQRKYALNGIINLYKSYFPNLDNEQAKIKALAGNYLDLANQIIKASKARAYDKMFEEKQSSLINSKGNQSTLRKEIDNAINEYRKEVEKGGRKLNLTNQEIFDKFYQQLKKYQDSGFPVSLSSDRVSGSLFSGVKGVDAVNDAILRYSESTRRTAKSQKELNDLRAEFVKDVEKGNVDILGGGGVVSTSDVDNSRAISNNLSSTADSVKQTIDYLKELQSLSGVSEKDISLVGKVGLDFDVASIKYDYEERIKQIQTLQEQILADTTLTESKRKELIEETNTYIAYLTGNVLANIKDLSNKATEYLDKMTVKAVKTYKDVEIVESPKQKQGRNREDDKDWKDYANILNQSVNSVFTNLKSNIDEFGLKARSVFYTLGESLGDLIKQLANKNTAKFMESITKDAKSWADIKNNFNDMWKNNKGQVIGAGLGMAGSAVLSMSSASDSVGQGLGGALSGAGAGAVIGSQIMPGIGTAYGAAIGAVVGGVSGLLKAAKNRRQEKILLEQYEEQKKANRLLERMSALSYASQIIGQKTEYGIVSGVRRNEFGQIVSVVQGQDIIMVADRANQQKGR